MRYDDWDVILFPRDSHVPIQEFRTACFVSQVEYGRQLPILTSFISSLPPSAPFRISLHSWRATSKASVLLESQRKNNQKIVFAVQVMIDEVRVFHGFFDLASKWPQEIAHERRSLTFNDLPSSQCRRPLEFPFFHNLTLSNNTWDARDPYGRIQVVLSEQLVNKTSSPGNSDLGPIHELVCFSFQHAPRDILQRTGISWPIKNPLYLPDMFNKENQYSRESPSTSWTPGIHSVMGNMNMQTPPSRITQPMFAGSHNTESKRHPNTHLPPITHFSKQFADSTGQTYRASTWDAAFSSLGHGGNATSKDNWSAKKRTPASSDNSTSNYVYTSHPPANGPPCMSNMSQNSQNENTEWDDHTRNRKEKQFVVALRDDQLGQIIDATSPPKHNREHFRTPVAPYCDSVGQRTAQAYYPPKFVTAPPIKRPSSAFRARKLSYPDPNNVLRNASNKLSLHKHYSQDDGKGRMPTMQRSSFSTNKEDIAPSQLRLPTSFPQINNVSTPNSFTQGQPKGIPELSMRNWSFTRPNAYCFDRSEAPPPSTELGRLGSAHGPSNVNIRSRKEGMASDSPKLLHQAIRHDQSPIPTASSESRTGPSAIPKVQSTFAYNNGKNISELVEIIDVDAIDPSLNPNAGMDNSRLSPFKSSHKSGVSLSSIGSTIRLERQLFSALGEELGSFDHQIDTTGMGPELAQALGGATTNSEPSGSAILDSTRSNFEPTIKRKRQGTLGGDRGGSPMSKKEKADFVEDEEKRVVVSMRGD